MHDAVSQLAMNQVHMASELQVIAAKVDPPSHGIGDLPKRDL